MQAAGEDVGEGASSGAGAAEEGRLLPVESLEEFWGLKWAS